MRLQEKDQDRKKKTCIDTVITLCNKQQYMALQIGIPLPPPVLIQMFIGKSLKVTATPICPQTTRTVMNFLN